MVEKRELPLKLDMGFDEAMTRFSKTDSREIPSTKLITQPRKRRMGRAPQPFKFTLLPAEIEQITSVEIVGSGGLQTLLRNIRAQLEAGSVAEFDDEGLGKLIRYMTRYDPDGGFETRLRRAFLRSIYGLFATELAI